ncbi:MAG TPA: hypothetical protein PKC91_14130 [Ignavibacteria bacterium]|nr:hypothetical protein [Ignavibacteria bacterium]
MNKQFSKEELYHSLPDFISGKLSDPGLENLIRNEIEINPEFRDEYADLCDTFNFLESASLESPSEVYFNNLSVKINNSIDQEKHHVSFLDKMAGFRKIFIPSGLAIIAAFIILFSFLNSDKNLIPENKEEIISKSEVTNNNNNNIDNSEKEISAADTSLGNNINSQSGKSNNQSVTLSKNVVRSNTSFRKIHSPITGSESTSIQDKESILKESHLNLGLIAINIQNIENSDISEQEEDNLFIKETDEFNLDDDDIMKLTPEEEKEILENLYNSKI